MALSVSQTIALAEVLKPGMKIASFGYPDMIAEPSLLAKFGVEPNYLKDSERICARHGIRARGIPDAVEFFKSFGCELDVYDIVQERGCEILCDLNNPIPMMIGARQKYDIVLDVGTSEHCFNIGQALFNMAGLVKVGGYIIHENPHSSWGNHGFYSLHPTLFHDFYTQNGFELVKCQLTTREGRVFDVPSTKRYDNSHESNVFAMAKRKEAKSFKFPNQSKYAKLIADAAPRAMEVVNG